MTHALMLVPSGLGTGLTTTVLGLFHALRRQGVRVHFFKPLSQPRNQEERVERSGAILQPFCPGPIATPLEIRCAERLLSQNRGDELLEEIVGRYQSGLAKDVEITLIEGMVPTRSQPYATRINKEIAWALDAEVVLVAAPGDDSLEAFQDHIDITARAYGGTRSAKVIGCILNKLGAPLQQRHQLDPGQGEASPRALDMDAMDASHPLFGDHFRLLGRIPWRPRLEAPRLADLAHYLGATALHQGELDERRVLRTRFCARSAANLAESFTAGTLILAPADRDDIIMAACLAALKGIKLAGLVLTEETDPHPGTLDLCQGALDTGLPLLRLARDSYSVIQWLARYESELPLDDRERVELTMEMVASFMDTRWLSSYSRLSNEHRLSPPAFRHQLVERARAAKRCIVLPEGEEPRTIKAAAVAAKRGIARCVLLGNPQTVQRLAAGQGIGLDEGVEVLDPEAIRHRYLDRLVTLRAHRGMTSVIAEEELRDNVMLGTLMLELGEVDGLVSGAVHTTANTIRPALQLIRTAPGCSLVSSIFFMCLPEQVLVYGDCAINPDPNAEQLADIALQSADSAAAFGITPRVAMVSYSTGDSGTGADVDKVRRATAIAREHRPDLLIDGPLQYDAAVMENVARSKAPDSPVAGRATVLVFPDLNTGNTTYKAVQRSAEVVSIGPMLQGMRRPVNDLSRGALVDDIVFTIALTAIQAAAAQADTALAQEQPALAPQNGPGSD